MIHPAGNLIYGGWDADEAGIDAVRKFCVEKSLTEHDVSIKRKGNDVYLLTLKDLEIV